MMKRSLKKLLAMMLALMMVFSLAACSSSDSAADSGASTDSAVSADSDASADSTDSTPQQEFKVGWSIDTVSSPYNAALDTFMKDAWSAYPEVTLYSTQANAQALQQVSDIEDLIAKGIDVLIVKARDEMTVTEALREAQEAGVKVIMFDRNVITDYYDHYIGVDAFSLGATLGERLLETFPEQEGETVKYVYLEGTAGASTNLDQIEAFNETIAKSGRTDIECIGNQPSNAKRDEGKKLMENWIQANGSEIDAVISVTDELTIGAIQALEEAGIEGVEIFSINAIMEIVPYIIDGTVNTSVAVAAGVHPCVEIVWQILNGNDNFAQRYTIPGMPITAENAEQYYDESKYIVAMCEPMSENVLMKNLFEVFPELADLEIRE